MSSTNEIAVPSSEATSPARCCPSPLMFWGGLLLSIVSLAAFIGQVFGAKVLVTPWYMPIGGTIGLLLMFAAMARGFRWWQAPFAMLASGLAGLEWLFLLNMSLLPAYTGPIGAGSGVPEFHAQLADGTAIDQAYFTTGGPTALVFFQGRWCPFCMTHLTELEQHHAELDKVGGRVVVISIEGLEDAKATQRDFPHLTVISDEKRELATAVDLLNPNFSPTGADSAAPTVLYVDKEGIVTSVYRPARFIERPSAAELARRLSGK